MSRPAPNPKSQMLTMMLWVAMLILGYQLFFNQKQEVIPHADQLKTLRTLNAEIKDQTIGHQIGKYESAVNGDQKLTQIEKDRLILEAKVLVADTRYKAAIQRQDFGRVIPSADDFIALQRHFSGSPLWNEQVAVASHPDFPRSTITPAEMKDLVRETSVTLGKTTPVWNFFPGYEMLDFLISATGRNPGFSYAFACLLLAVAVRLIIFPLSHRQMMWGRQMSQLSPLITEIRKKYETKDGKPMSMDVQAKMNQETMALYSEYGVNPAAGCAPALLQMPLFLLVYQSMLHYRFEFERGTFLWINPQVGQSTHGFLASNLGQKDYLLLVIYAVSMIATTLLTPVSDPANARQQRLMGVGISALFGVMMFFWPVPSAFVLYWVFLNILATAQSLWTYRLPLPPLQKKNTPTGGVFPPDGGLNGKLSEGPRKTGIPQRHTPKKKKK